MEDDIENFVVFIFPMSLQIPPSWLGIDLVASEAEDMGEVGLNLQCKKKKKIPCSISLCWFWPFLKSC